MNISKKTREVLEKHPEAAYDDALLLILVWRYQGIKLPNDLQKLLSTQKPALPSTVLRAKARIVKKKKQGGL